MSVRENWVPLPPYVCPSFQSCASLMSLRSCFVVAFMAFFSVLSPDFNAGGGDLLPDPDRPNLCRVSDGARQRREVLVSELLHALGEGPESFVQPRVFGDAANSTRARSANLARLFIASPVAVPSAHQVFLKHVKRVP